MNYSWDDSLHDVVNPDLSLLMSDCPAELSIQSHGLMLNVRRSLQLPITREGTTSGRNQVPIAKEVAALRRVQSFQYPVVSTSLGPSGGGYATLSRVRSFFDFSRKDAQALDSEVSHSLRKTGEVVAGGDGEVKEDDNHNAGGDKVEANEAPAACDVKHDIESKLLNESEAQLLNNVVTKEVDANGTGLDKSATGTAGPLKVDVSETIKKIESALEEALTVGSLKIDVRERIKRIQTAFEGFVPWDSALGKPKERLKDLKPVDKVEAEESLDAGVVKLPTVQSDAGGELEQERKLKEIKQGAFDDPKVGDEGRTCNPGLLSTQNDCALELNKDQIILDMKEERLDVLCKVAEVQVDISGEATVEVLTYPQTDGEIDELDDERIFLVSNRVKEVEVVKPVLTEIDALSKEERLPMVVEQRGLSASYKVDEVQAFALNSEAVNPMVAESDPISEVKVVRMNNDRIEEGPKECVRGTQLQAGSPCNAAASRSLRIQSAAIDELKKKTTIKDVREEGPEYCDRSPMVEGFGHAAIVNIGTDASGELNQIVKDRIQRGFQDSAEVDKVICCDTPTAKSRNLQSDDKLNTVHETTPWGAAVGIPWRSRNDPINVLGQEMIIKDMSVEVEKDLNGVDDVRLDTLCHAVGVMPLGTQSTTFTDLEHKGVVKEVKTQGLRKPIVKVAEVQAEEGGDSGLSEKDTSDISRLPSPLSQLLGYRHGSAFTFLNVQEHFHDIGECLLHDEERVCLLERTISHTEPSFSSMETNLKSLLTPGEVRRSRDEQRLQGTSRKKSDSGRSKGTISLRRFRIRKSVRPHALKVSPTNLPADREVDPLGLRPSDLSQAIRNLCEDDTLLEFQSNNKPAEADYPQYSNPPLHSVVDQAPFNVGEDNTHVNAGDMSMKLRTVPEPSLEPYGMYKRSRLHVVKKIPANSASVIRLNVESHKNLSEKYRPTRFEELVGQAMVVKTLATSTSMRKVAPLYLFLGPRGTGKTSAARIFAAGLNCFSLESKVRPCGSCGECKALTLDMSPSLKIVDAATIRDSSSIKTLINHSASRVGYKVIIIKGCQLLITETWAALLKVMEEPPTNVVVILMCTDVNCVPLSAIPRCKMLHFYKVSDREIADRLQALGRQEDLEVEEGTLSLIASRSDGSIHDAEIILDQLSLVDKRVSLASVQELVGLLPDRKLLDLLESAMSADIANTTQAMNEILDSGIEPFMLVSQLGTLITNILVENFDVHQETRKDGSSRPSFSTKTMQQRLRRALKILSEAEKHLRVSTDSLHWLTASLLQCASDSSFPPSISVSLTHTPVTPKRRGQGLEITVSRDVAAENELASEPTREGHKNRILKPSKPSSGVVELSVENNLVMFERELEEAWAQESQEAEAHRQAADSLNAQGSHQAEDVQVFGERDSIDLWNRVIQVLTSRNLKHLLQTQGRLVSAGVANDGSNAIVELEFQSASDKHKAERSWRSICIAFQSVLSIPIELRISLMENVVDDALLPRNLEDMDEQDRALLTHYRNRLKQEAEAALNSTDMHGGPHSKRKRRRARRYWQSPGTLEQELEIRHRSETGSVPGPMQPTQGHKDRRRRTARPTVEWHTNGIESIFSELVEHNSGNCDIGNLAGSKAPANRKSTPLSALLNAPENDTDDNRDTQSKTMKQKLDEFRTDRGLPPEAFCFPCTQRMTGYRREPARDVDEYKKRRGKDLRAVELDGRGRAQAQRFLLRLVPCKSISTVRKPTQ